MAIVSVNDISKSYGKTTKALRNVSFSVNEGEIFGIIGPDGAGKTTLFRILATLLLADSGTASVLGHDVVTGYRDIRRGVGYMPGRFSLYQDLTVEENLEFFASVFGTTINENYHLIADIYSQIEPFKNRRAGKLSGGMKQKLALSCALIHAPKVIFLDEPTTGVDPVSRKEFWEMLKKLRCEYGITILVSTPYMDEAIQCDRIALIQEGEIMKVDTPKGIINAFSQALWAVSSDKMHKLLQHLRSHDDVISAFSFGESYHVTVSQSASMDTLRQYLESLGHHNVSISAADASIEDCFISLLKNNNGQ